MFGLIRGFYAEFEDPTGLTAGLKNACDMNIWPKKPYQGVYKNTVIIFKDSNPVAIYAFVAIGMESIAWGDGIFVAKDQRGRKLGLYALDALVSVLQRRRIRKFYIGQSPWGLSRRIRNTVSAQGWANKVIARYQRSVIELKQTKGGIIESFGLNLEKAAVVLAFNELSSSPLKVPERIKNVITISILGRQIILTNTWDVYETRIGENGEPCFECVRLIMALEKNPDLIRPGDNVLIIGCGNGIDTIAALLMGANVTSIDVNSDPVELTIYNLKINGLWDENRVKVLVHEGLEGLGQYDRIIWHTPEPVGDYFRRWLEDPGVYRYFISKGELIFILRSMPQHLSERGYGVFCRYFYSKHDLWTKVIKKANLAMTVVLQKREAIPEYPDFLGSGVVKLSPPARSNSYAHRSSSPLATVARGHIDLLSNYLPADVAAREIGELPGFFKRISTGLSGSSSPLERVEGLVDELKAGLINDDPEEARQALDKLKEIDRRILREKGALGLLLGVFFDERIDSLKYRSLILKASSLFQEVRNNYWSAISIDRLFINQIMKREVVPLEQQHAYFFDEEQGTYTLLRDTVVPEVIKSFINTYTQGGKVKGHSAGGVSFYAEGARLFGAYQAALLFIESGLSAEKLEIVVTSLNWLGLVQGKKGYFGLEWFIREDRPLSMEDKQRIKKHFQFTEDGRIRVRPHIRKTVKTRQDSLLTFRRPNSFHFVLYNFVEYKVEMRQAEKNSLRTNIVAGNIIDNLRDGGLVLTTAEKWFPSQTGDFPYSRTLVLLKAGMAASAYFGKDKITGIARAYKKILSTVNEYTLDEDYFQIIREAFIYNKTILMQEAADTNIIDTAYTLAKGIHAKQKRANGEPYLLHLLTVVTLLLLKFDLFGEYETEQGVSYEIILAIALLHDALEEDKDAITKIREGFQAAAVQRAVIEIILAGVIELSKTVDEEEDETDFIYLARIANSSWGYIKLIKIADRLHNLMTPRYKWGIKKAADYLAAGKFFISSIKEGELDYAKQIFMRETNRLYTGELAKQGLVTSSPVDQLDRDFSAGTSDLTIKAEGVWENRILPVEPELVAGHTKRVSILAFLFIRKLREYDFKISQLEEAEIIAAALLHDIGKLKMPIELLHGSSSFLNAAEMAYIHRHAQDGADILTQEGFPQPVIDIVRFHHEQPDGKGYPQGLKGEEIPFGSRIIALCDSWDAIVVKRAYQDRFTVAATITIMKPLLGTKYDIEAGKAFLKMLESDASLQWIFDRLSESSEIAVVPQISNKPSSSPVEKRHNSRAYPGRLLGEMAASSTEQMQNLMRYFDPQMRNQISLVDKTGSGSIAEVIMNDGRVEVAVLKSLAERAPPIGCLGNFAEISFQVFINDLQRFIYQSDQEDPRQDAIKLSIMHFRNLSYETIKFLIAVNQFRIKLDDDYAVALFQTAGRHKRQAHIQKSSSSPAKQNSQKGLLELATEKLRKGLIGKLRKLAKGIEVSFDANEILKIGHEIIDVWQGTEPISGRFFKELTGIELLMRNSSLDIQDRLRPIVQDLKDYIEFSRERGPFSAKKESSSSPIGEAIVYRKSQTWLPGLERALSYSEITFEPDKCHTAFLIHFIQSNPQRFKGRILELGTGAGPIAFALARVGAGQVVAVDIMPQAIDDARENLLAESAAVQNKVILGESDLYSQLSVITGEINPRFDAVVFMHPIVPIEQDWNKPSTFRGCAGNDFEVIRRALLGLPAVIFPHSRAYFWAIDAPENNPLIWGFPQLNEALPAGFAFKDTGFRYAEPECELKSAIVEIFPLPTAGLPITSSPLQTTEENFRTRISSSPVESAQSDKFIEDGKGLLKLLIHNPKVLAQAGLTVDNLNHGLTNAQSKMLAGVLEEYLSTYNQYFLNAAFHFDGANYRVRGWQDSSEQIVSFAVGATIGIVNQNLGQFFGGSFDKNEANRVVAAALAILEIKGNGTIKLISSSPVGACLNTRLTVRSLRKSFNEVSSSPLVSVTITEKNRILSKFVEFPGETRKNIAGRLGIVQETLKKRLDVIAEELLEELKGVKQTASAGRVMLSDVLIAGLRARHKGYNFGGYDEVMAAASRLREKEDPRHLTAAEVCLLQDFVRYVTRGKVIAETRLSEATLRERLRSIRSKLNAGTGISDILSKAVSKGYDLGGIERVGLIVSSLTKAEAEKGIRPSENQLGLLRSVVAGRLLSEKKDTVCLSRIRKKLGAREGLADILEKALQAGWNIGQRDKVKERIIQLKGKEANPLHQSQIRLLEAALKFGLEKGRISHDDLRKELGSQGAVNGIIAYAKHNLGIKVAVKSNYETIIQCVIKAAEKGYIKCDKEQLERFKSRFFRNKLPPVLRKILILQALGLEKMLVSYKYRRTLDIYNSRIRKLLGLAGKSMHEVIRFALKNREIAEKDIITMAIECNFRGAIDEEVMIEGIKYALGREYLPRLKGFPKLIKSISMQEEGILGGQAQENLTPGQINSYKESLLSRTAVWQLSLDELKVYYEIYRLLNGVEIADEGFVEQSESGDEGIRFAREQDIEFMGIVDNGNGDLFSEEDIRLLCERRDGGDKKALEQLEAIGWEYAKNAKTASWFNRSYDIDKDDFIQEAWIFIHQESAPNFNPDKGAKYKTYVINGLRDFLAPKLRVQHNGQVRMLTHATQRILNAKRSLEEELGRSATLEEISRRSRSKKDTVAATILINPKNSFSFQDPVSQEDARERSDLIGDKAGEEDFIPRIDLQNIMGHIRKEIERINEIGMRREGKLRIPLDEQVIFIYWLRGYEWLEINQELIDRGLPDKHNKQRISQIVEAVAEKIHLTKIEERFGLHSLISRSSSPLSGKFLVRPKLTGQESLIFEEIVKEAIAGEFKGLFDRVVKNIADKFLITLSRERVRNALSDVRRKFGIKVDKTSVKGTRSTISGLSELILKAKDARLEEVANVAETDIEKIRTKESNPLNEEVRKILILVLEGKSSEEIVKDMHFPDSWVIYRRVLNGVYGKIPNEARGAPDNWRHSQLINAAKYALTQGWIAAESTYGADKIITNPLTRRERSILETAVNALVNSSRQIAERLNLQLHTIQINFAGIVKKLNIRGATIAECVRIAYEAGYINCSEIDYSVFVCRYCDNLRLSKRQEQVLIYSALGFTADKIALRLKVSRRYITTDIFGSVRQKLGIKLRAHQRTSQIIDEIIKTALEKKAIFESDILSAIWQEERILRLALIQHVLAKNYFTVLNGVLRKLSNKLTLEQTGVLEAKDVEAQAESAVMPDATVIDTSLVRGETHALNREDYEELPELENSEFSEIEEDDMEMETLRSYFAFKYPTRQEQKILAQSIKEGKEPNASVQVKARAKQAQDKLITATMQHIVKKARDFKRRFPSNVSLFDLCHESVEYIIKRLDKFDPDKGDFSAFIIGAKATNGNMSMLDHQFSRIMATKCYGNGAKLPVNIFSQVRRVNGAAESIEQESGGNVASISQIADRLGARRSTVMGTMQLRGLTSTVSINEPINQHDDRQLVDILGAEEDIPGMIDLANITVEVRASIRKAIERYNRYELKHYRRGHRITPLQEFLFMQLLIENKSIEEVKDMAEERFGHRIGTKQNLSAKAWSVVRKLNIKVKRNSLKPFFNFKEVEQKTGIDGLFGRITRRRSSNSGETQKKSVSSPVIGNPVILNQPIEDHSEIYGLIKKRIKEFGSGKILVLNADAHQDYDLGNSLLMNIGNWGSRLERDGLGYLVWLRSYHDGSNTSWATKTNWSSADERRIILEKIQGYLNSGEIKEIWLTFCFDFFSLRTSIIIGGLVSSAGVFDMEDKQIESEMRKIKSFLAANHIPIARIVPAISRRYLNKKNGLIERFIEGVMGKIRLVFRTEPVKVDWNISTTKCWLFFKRILEARVGFSESPLSKKSRAEHLADSYYIELTHKDGTMAVRVNRKNPEFTFVFYDNLRQRVYIRYCENGLVQISVDGKQYNEHYSLPSQNIGFYPCDLEHDFNFYIEGSNDQFTAVMQLGSFPRGLEAVKGKVFLSESGHRLILSEKRQVIQHISLPVFSSSPVKGVSLEKVCIVGDCEGVHEHNIQQLVELANKFLSRIYIQYNNRTADLKNVLDSLPDIIDAVLSSWIQATEIKLIAEGEDAALALDTLGIFISEGFGEGTLSNLLAKIENEKVSSSVDSKSLEVSSPIELLRFSERQLVVLKLLCQNESYKGIGGILQLSHQGAVKKIVYSILDAFGLRHNIKKVRPQLIEKARQLYPDIAVNLLTDTEKDILALIQKGMARSADIAARRRVNIDAIKRHIRGIKEKLGVKERGFGPGVAVKIMEATKKELHSLPQNKPVFLSRLQIQALSLRAQGLTFEEINDKLKIARSDVICGPAYIKRRAKVMGIKIVLGRGGQTEPYATSLKLIRALQSKGQIDKDLELSGLQQKAREERFGFAKLGVLKLLAGGKSLSEIMAMQGRPSYSSLWDLIKRSSVALDVDMKVFAEADFLPLLRKARQVGLISGYLTIDELISEIERRIEDALEKDGIIKTRLNVLEELEAEALAGKDDITLAIVEQYHQGIESNTNRQQPFCSSSPSVVINSHLKGLKQIAESELNSIMPHQPASIQVDASNGRRRYLNIGTPLKRIEAQVYVKEGVFWQVPESIVLPDGIANNSEGALVFTAGSFYEAEKFIELFPGCSRFIRELSPDETYKRFGLRRVYDDKGEPFSFPALAIGGRSILLPLSYRIASSVSGVAADQHVFGLELKNIGTPVYNKHNINRNFPATVFDEHVGKSGIFLDWWHQVASRIPVGLGKHELNILTRQKQIMANGGTLSRLAVATLPLFDQYGVVMRLPLGDYRRLNIFFDHNGKPNDLLYQVASELFSYKKTYYKEST